MKKILIVGAAGFVGGHLIRHIQSAYDWEIHATKMPGEDIPFPGVLVYDLNILDKDRISELLCRIRPDYIIHLAAQSSVSVAWKNPELTVNVNIIGSIHMMDAVRKLDYKPRVLLIGSGEEYGRIKKEEVPIRENNDLRPGNIYAVTKACQSMIGKIYAEAYQMELMMVKAFNHIGPEQLPLFVVSDFCKQVAEIELGKREPVIRVGNLQAYRDFTDVRDVVRAYALLVQFGKAGEIYNVGSGNAIEIAEVLKLILENAHQKIDVVIDKERLRPVDVPIIVADITKINEATGWKPEISLNQSLADTLAYWRQRLEQ